MSEEKSFTPPVWKLSITFLRLKKETVLWIAEWVNGLALKLGGDSIFEIEEVRDESLPIDISED